MARYYKNIHVYGLSYSFVLKIYNVLETFPKSELNNIVSQLKRAAVSIPLNIAEGSAKASHKEFTYFLNVAYGSAKEVEVLLELSKDLGYLDENKYLDLSNHLNELNAKLYLFIRNIESKIKSNRHTFFKKFEEKSKKELF